jgi:hypothetical protein
MRATLRPLAAALALSAVCLASAPAHAWFETYELACDSIQNGVATDGNTGRRTHGSVALPQRYVVDTEAGTVTAAFSAAPGGGWHEHPQFISDIRRMDDRMLVFCDNEVTACQPRFENSSDRVRFSTLLTVSPVTIDLVSGRLTATTEAVRTHLASGAYIRHEAIIEGRCTRMSE